MVVAVSSKEVVSDTSKEGTMSAVVEDEGTKESHEGLNFRERIMRCCDVLNIDIPEMVRDDSLCSFETPAKEQPVTFPPSKKFLGYLDDWKLNMEGAEGSTQYKKHPDKVAKMQVYPSAFAVKSTSYEVRDSPWGSLPLKNPSMLKSAVYNRDKKPYLKVSNELMDQWETGSRESLSIMNSTEHFILGARQVLQNVMDRLQDGTLSEADMEDVWDEVGQARDILASAGKGVHDMTKRVVDTLGAQVNVRRDAWIGGMSSVLSDEEKVAFRSDPFWGTHDLLEKERLTQLSQVLERKTTTRVQMACLEDRSKGNGGGRNKNKGQEGKKDSDSKSMSRKPYKAGKKSDSTQQHDKSGNSKKNFSRKPNFKGGRS